MICVSIKELEQIQSTLKRVLGDEEYLKLSDDVTKRADILTKHRSEDLVFSQEQSDRISAQQVCINRSSDCMVMMLYDSTDVYMLLAVT